MEIWENTVRRVKVSNLTHGKDGRKKGLAINENIRTSVGQFEQPVSVSSLSCLRDFSKTLQANSQWKRVFCSSRFTTWLGISATFPATATSSGFRFLSTISGFASSIVLVSLRARNQIKRRASDDQSSQKPRKFIKTLLNLSHWLFGSFYFILTFVIKTVYA